MSGISCKDVFKYRLTSVFLKEISKIYDGDKKKLELDEFIKQLVVLKKRITVIHVNLISMKVMFILIRSFNVSIPTIGTTEQNVHVCSKRSVAASIETKLVQVRVVSFSVAIES